MQELVDRFSQPTLAGIDSWRLLALGKIDLRQPLLRIWRGWVALRPLLCNLTRRVGSGLSQLLGQLLSHAVALRPGTIFVPDFRTRPDL